MQACTKLSADLWPLSTVQKSKFRCVSHKVQTNDNIISKPFCYCCRCTAQQKRSKSALQHSRARIRRRTARLLPGMACYSMIWCGMAWYGRICYVTICQVWHGVAWYGMEWYGVAYHDMSWHGTTWYDVAWYGMVRHAMP